MAGIVGRITGQILGKAPGRSGYTSVTITSKSARSAANPQVVLAIAPACIAQWNVGDTVTVYVAYDPADITAIEAATSVVDLLGTA